MKSPSASVAASAANGTVRRSRVPRVFARLTRIRRIQVFSEERPSKRSMPLSDREPRLLHDLLGDRAARRELPRQPQHRRAELIDERHERRLVPGAQSRRQAADRPSAAGASRCVSLDGHRRAERNVARAARDDVGMPTDAAAGFPPCRSDHRADPRWRCTASPSSVVSPARVAATGNEIALEVTPGSFGTPALPDGGRVRVDVDELVVDEPGGVARRAPLTTIGAARRFAGLDETGGDDEPLAVGRDAARVLAGFYAFA